MYKQGDRVHVTSWELDLQRTEVLTGTVESVGENNEVTVLMDNGESSASTPTRSRRASREQHA